MIGLKGIKPYSDNKMIWNEENQQYELTFEYCKSEFEPNFATDEILKKRIKKNSKVVYRFINNRVNQFNKAVILKLINRTEQGRRFIFEMLTTQFEADVDSGYNDLTKSPAVNLADGSILPREELKRNEVSVETENVWDDSQAYFGINLGYQAQFPAYYFLFARGL